MKFSEFLNKLYDSSHKPSKELYVLEIFSALCGESDPFGSNKNYDSRKLSKFSSDLPEGLTGGNPTYRRRLYKGENPQYKGLSNPIKKHIRGRESKVTFINYLEKTVSSEELPKLCIDFGISDTVDKSVMFESIYDQFLKFVYSPSDDIKSIVLDRVKELSTTEPDSTQLKSKSTKKDDVLQSETPSEQMREVFEDAVQKNCLVDFIRYDPTVLLDDELLPKAEIFLEVMKSEIIDEFRENYDETLMYKKLVEFYNELKSYVVFSKVGFISSPPPYQIDDKRNIIKSLYYGICPYKRHYEYSVLP